MKEKVMKRSTWGKVFLLLVLLLAAQPTQGGDPGYLCDDGPNETCIDKGCAAKVPVGHFKCTYSQAIGHCGCELLY